MSRRPPATATPKRDRLVWSEYRGNALATRSRGARDLMTAAAWAGRATHSAACRTTSIKSKRRAAIRAAKRWLGRLTNWTMCSRISLGKSANPIVPRAHGGSCDGAPVSVVGPAAMRAPSMPDISLFFPAVCTVVESVGAWLRFGRRPRCRRGYGIGDWVTRKKNRITRTNALSLLLLPFLSRPFRRPLVGAYHLIARRAMEQKKRLNDPTIHAHAYFSSYDSRHVVRPVNPARRAPRPSARQRPVSLVIARSWLSSSVFVDPCRGRGMGGTDTGRRLRQRRPLVALRTHARSWTGHKLQECQQARLRKKIAHPTTTHSLLPHKRARENPRPAGPPDRIKTRGIWRGREQRPNGAGETTDKGRRVLLLGVACEVFKVSTPSGCLSAWFFHIVPTRPEPGRVSAKQYVRRRHI